jgi:hypothetical protein
MALTEFLGHIGEAGLVFTLMAIAIYFLARAYYRMQKKYEGAVQEFTDFLKENQAKQVETISKFYSLLKAVKEGFDDLKRR